MPGRKAHLPEQPGKDQAVSGRTDLLNYHASFQRSLPTPYKLQESATKFTKFHRNLPLACISREHELLRI